MKKNLNTKELLMGLMLFAGTTIQVQAQVAVETFDYDLSSELEGLESDNEGWGGAWTVFEGTPSDMTIVEPIPAEGLSMTGNRLCGALSKNAGTRAYRLLDSPWTDDGEDVWFSYLLEEDGANAIPESWIGCSLWKGTSEDFYSGKQWGGSLLCCHAGLSPIEMIDGEQYWIAVLIKMSGDASNERIYMWINPDPTAEPDTSAADVNGYTNLNGGFDRVVCHLGATAGISGYYDEIRLGKQWADVSSSIVLQSTKENLVYNDNANHLITFKWGQTVNQPVQIDIYNLEGERIATLCGESSDNIPWNTSNVQKGVYIYKMTAGSATQTAKIAVL